MKNQNDDRIAEILQLMNKGKYFTKLKLEHKEDKSFTIPLKVSSYNELNLIVSDLLKASIVLMNKEARSFAVFHKDTDINVLTLLEIALQLLPEDEMVLVDDLHKLHFQPDVLGEK
ncbi:hypothetical protein ASE21_20245 [Flavobacterium sp. Root901]|uniref:hypothetical protein n=1 Tax=Flavobacterium sp. Root901 TaxID=1736605 RepID=UPI000710248D|nr:hypothetical protein [Flavobacterium sp. Root901]KRD06488.1 hypothetical protein ASE21_20245 [Flavobacterium sp. Root901]